MIVPMKKIILVALEKYRQQTLLSLRKLGLLHIKYTTPLVSADIESLEQEIDQAQTAIALLSPYALQNGARFLKTGPDPVLHTQVKQIIALSGEEQALLKRKEDLKEQLSWYEQWGEFSPGSLRELSRQGVKIRLYRCSRKEWQGLRKSRTVELIKKQGSSYYLALIERGDETGINLKEEKLPDKDAPAFREELLQLEKRLDNIESALKAAAAYKKALPEYLDNLRRSLEFSRAKSGMQEAGKVCYLQGFMPAEGISRFKELAAKNGWAYLIEEPAESDAVPTLIKNPAWVRTIEPIFKFMGVLPGYREYDISFGFLLFFSLFFALIIGDAGYGLVFILTTFFLKKRLTSVPPEVFRLMYVLSFATLIWGAVSGNWFGFEPIGKLPFLGSVVVERVNSYIGANQNFMIQLCFIIAALHLSFAHAACALRIADAFVALSQLGWILIIWCLYFLAGNLVLARQLPDYFVIIFCSGAALVLLFSHPRRNPLKGIALTLADLPLKTVNSFADIISYLRLFAVGYATLVVAGSFNELALRTGFNNLLVGFASGLIIFLGHSLNIALGLMGVIVHGIRLNMLEFSSHLGMQWSGVEYKPFKE